MTDARAKILGAASLSLGALAPTSTVYALTAAAALAAWTIAAGIPPATIARRAWRIRWFVLAILAVNALTLPGTLIVEGAGLYLTREGVLAGVSQSLRLVIVFWAGSMIMLTTPLEDLMDIVEQWTAKKGRPLIAVGVVTINYLPLLIASARRVHAARRARGHDDGRGIVAGVRAASSSALPLFAVALRNADALADAMDARGYSPAAARTPFRQPRMPLRDAGVALLLVAATAAALLRLF